LYSRDSGQEGVIVVLRRIENVVVDIVKNKKSKSWFMLGDYSLESSDSGNLMLVVGSKRLITESSGWDLAKLEELELQSESYPTAFMVGAERTYWKYSGKWWVDNDGLSADDVYAILTSREKRSQQSLRRAHSIASMNSEPTQVLRGHISAELRQLIWSKYGGACSSCSSTVELQFDHIIPVALGGATSEENLQILCGPCNRSKGASIS